MTCQASSSPCRIVPGTRPRPRDAVDDARRKAELYATAAGAKVGAVVTINETLSAAGAADDAYHARSRRVMPIEPGEQKLVKYW